MSYVSPVRRDAPSGAGGELMDGTWIEVLRRTGADLAFTDELTGLYNRRLLISLFRIWWPRIVAEHQRVSLMILDLDGFKAINDTYGHLAGDCVLEVTAEVLRGSFRDDDVVVRYGGDEFVVVLPGVGAGEAGRLADRARAALADRSVTCRGSDVEVDCGVSFSLGVGSCPDDGSQADAVLAAADQRLLDDKRRRKPAAAGIDGPGRARWVPWAMAVAAVVAGGVLILQQQWTASAVAPAEETASVVDGSREAQLEAEIGRLRARLGQLVDAEGDARAATGSEGDVEAYRTQIEDLRLRVSQLTEELDRRKATVVSPPTRGPEVVPARPPRVRERTPVPSPFPSAPIVADRGRAVESPPDGDARAPVTFTSPVLVRHDPPRYPAIARALRHEATVELSVVVDAEGRVTRAEPTGSPAGFGLDEAAREAAFSAVYRPATRNGEPVEGRTTLRVHFRIGGR